MQIPCRSNIRKNKLRRTYSKTFSKFVFFFFYFQNHRGYSILRLFGPKCCSPGLLGDSCAPFRHLSYPFSPSVVRRPIPFGYLRRYMYQCFRVVSFCLIAGCMYGIPSISNLCFSLCVFCFFIAAFFFSLWWFWGIVHHSIYLNLWVWMPTFWRSCAVEIWGTLLRCGGVDCRWVAHWKAA